jgi:predicted DNA-binding transcriptional regulator YafY
MRRAERLFRLVNEMRTRGVSRANELAEHLEVSTSTIYRDIAHLQASGLPIEGEAGVGYLLRPGFDLPNVTFTHDQIDALAVGLSFVERTGDPDLASAAREVRAKIQASLPLPEERKLADAPYFSLHRKNGTFGSAGLIREAIRNRQVVQISYRNGEGIASERRVRPLVVWTLTDGWMFSAWCELREDFRTFRSDRIAHLAVTDDRFEDDEKTGLRAFMELETCGTRDN